MQKHKDIYTLNRENPDAIIYLDSDGKIIRLTREDFSSEEEFRHWKAVSDQQYQQEKRQENTYRKRKVTLLDCDQAKETPESSLAFQFDLQERVTRKQAAEIAIKQIQRMLTATQYRRLWMYGMTGMTEADIAKHENVSQQAVSKSLRAAIHRVRKYIKKM